MAQYGGAFLAILLRAAASRVFRDVEELIMAIGDYIDKHNDNPKPFVWTPKRRYPRKGQACSHCTGNR